MKEILEKEKDNIEGVFYLGQRLQIDRFDGFFEDCFSAWVKFTDVDKNGRPINEFTARVYLKYDMVNMVLTKSKLETPSMRVIK